MGLVINPRGTSGAGKTWLLREVMKAYCRDGAKAVSLRHDGRSRPMGCQLFHPHGGRALAVIGHYEAMCGGTDTIPIADEGLNEALRLADALAAGGNDVLMEGLQLSGDVERTAALAQSQRTRGSKLYVLCLDVQLGRCVQKVVARRRAGWAARPGSERTARAGHAALTPACTDLQHRGAQVERLDAAAALRRTLTLLGLDPARQDAPASSRLEAVPPEMSGATGRGFGLIAEVA